MDVPTNGAERLNYYVTARRRFLGVTRVELYQRGGPSPSTMNKAVSGSRNLSRASLDRLDRALGWAPGSSAAVLDGGTPTSHMSTPGACELAGGHHAHVLTVINAVRGHLRQAEQLLGEVIDPHAVAAPPR